MNCNIFLKKKKKIVKTMANFHGYSGNFVIIEKGKDGKSRTIKESRNPRTEITKLLDLI